MEEKSILNEIAEKTRARIAEEKKKVPMETLKEKIEVKKKGESRAEHSDIL